MIIRRIPMNALQKGVYSILSQYQTTPVYDDVPEDAVAPYITLGAFTCKQVGNKTADIYEISQQIHIWSSYDGKKEVNEIANDVTTVLTSWPMDMSADGFNAMSQDVDFFEAFPEEEEGYHGIITFVSKIQNLGG